MTDERGRGTWTEESGSWRDIAAPAVAAVIRRVGRQDEHALRAALRAALRDAYPFGERRCWPYKVWLDEIQRQIGHKPDNTHTPDLFVSTAERKP